MSVRMRFKALQSVTFSASSTLAEQRQAVAGFVLRFECKVSIVLHEYPEGDGPCASERMCVCVCTSDHFSVCSGVCLSMHVLMSVCVCSCGLERGVSLNRCTPKTHTHTHTTHERHGNNCI